MPRKWPGYTEQVKTYRFAALVLVVACVHTPAPAPVVLPPREALTQVLQAMYEAVARAEAERLAPFLVEDALVFSLGPMDSYNLRDTCLARVAQSLAGLALAGDSVRIVESHPVIGVAAGEHSAWLSDLPRVELLRGGVKTTWLPRLTAHAVLVDGRWVFDAVHVSLAVPDAIVFAPDAAKGWPPPPELSNQHAKDSDELVGLTRRLLEDFAVKLERTSDRDEFLQVGTAPAEVFASGRRFKELVRPQLAAIQKAGYSWKLDGPLRTGLSADGNSGWAAGNVVLRVGGPRKAQVLPPFRTLWLFVKEAGVWNLAGEHQSLGVREEARFPATEEELRAWAARTNQDAGVEPAGIGAW